MKIPLSSVLSRKTILVALFSLFLFPYSIAIDGAGISANYAYLLIPFFALMTNRLRMPDMNTRVVIGLYFVIFLAAVVYQISNVEFMFRRTVSFILFISIFSYRFIDVDLEMAEAFKSAVILVAVYFSLAVFFKYVSLGGAKLGFAAKGAVGGQRMGFVHILAIWLLYYRNSPSRFALVVRYSLLVVVGAGLFLTFSRSGIVALIGSLGMFAAYNLLKWLGRPRVGGVIRGVLFILGLIIAVSIMYKNIPVVFDFFNDRLFSHFSGIGMPTFDFADQEGSEGYRLFMTRKVMDFVIHNPVTGSGYLGVWILFPDHQGSAHSQYLDVLFRTGFVGFFAYLFVMYAMLKKFSSVEPGFFWGVIGVLLYGFFHETFKLSQGAFILTFLLGVPRTMYLTACAKSTEPDGAPN